MEVELFVHGVPSGHSFFGKEDGRNYCGQFYTSGSEEAKFLIQTAVLNGKAYCYYNYLVYKSIGASSPNVVANNGRDGSYFGMTIRLDAYCKDIFNMYRILDTIFNVYVVGNILMLEKSKLKYTILDFNSEQSRLNSIFEATYQLIRNAFSAESFVPLGGFSTSSGNNFPKSNLYDCNSDKVMSTVRQYSGIVVSPFYPTSKEAIMLQQFNAKLQAQQQQFDARLKDEADVHVREQNEITTAKGQVAQMQRELSQKDSEISLLRAELRNVGQGKKIAQVVAPIREPISQLASMLEQIATDGNGNNDNKVLTYFSFIKSFAPLINLLLLLIVIWLFSPYSRQSSVNEDLQNKIESLEKNIQELKEQLNIATKRFPSAEQGEANGGIFDINQVKLDIKNYNGGPLKLHQTYDVEAKNGVDEGTWDVEGCTMTKTDRSTFVKITPTANNVKITYIVNGQEKSRTLTAK